MARRLGYTESRYWKQPARRRQDFEELLSDMAHALSLKGAQSVSLRLGSRWPAPSIAAPYCQMDGHEHGIAIEMTRPNVVRRAICIFMEKVLTAAANRKPPKGVLR